MGNRGSPESQRNGDQRLIGKSIFDGEYYDGDAGVKKLGSFPTKEEAQAKVVTLLLSPARQILGVVKTLQEKLEKGEAIAKL